MRKDDMEQLAELCAKKTAKMVMEQFLGRYQLRTPGTDEEEEYVDSKEAARILGISPNYLRSKKDKFPHIKVGNNNQGRVLFKRSELLANYTK